MKFTELFIFSFSANGDSLCAQEHDVAQAEKVLYENLLPIILLNI